MWLRGRWLSYVGVMLVVPLCCEAQGRSTVRWPRFDPAMRYRDRLRSGCRCSGSRTFLWFAILILDVGDYTSSALIFGGLGAAVGLGIDALCDRHSSCGWAATCGAQTQAVAEGRCDSRLVRLVIVSQFFLPYSARNMRHDVCRLGDCVDCSAEEPPQFASSCDGNRVAIPSFRSQPGISHDVHRRCLVMLLHVRDTGSIGPRSLTRSTPGTLPTHRQR